LQFECGFHLEVGGHTSQAANWQVLSLSSSSHCIHPSASMKGLLIMSKATMDGQGREKLKSECGQKFRLQKLGFIFPLHLLPAYRG
jgi:hypothetical protein